MHVMKVAVLDQGDGFWSGSFNVNDLELEIIPISGNSRKKVVLAHLGYWYCSHCGRNSLSGAEKPLCFFPRYLLLFQEEDFSVLWSPVKNHLHRCSETKFSFHCKIGFSFFTSSSPVKISFFYVLNWDLLLKEAGSDVHLVSCFLFASLQAENILGQKGI